MTVELRGMLLHHLLGVLHGILTMEFGSCLVGLLLGVLINEEIFDIAGTSCSLIDGKARRKFPMCTYLYSIQHCHSEILAVVADEIICWSLLPHIVNDHFS